MTDTVYADVSEFQVDADNAYPYRFIAIRSNDGTYRDRHLAENLAWSKHRCDTGHLDGFLVYFVFEANWRDTVRTLVEAVGKPHPRMAVMIDVESWGGKIAGDHSAEINACRETVIAWFAANSSRWARLRRLPRKRVIGYANEGDFAALWPRRRDARVVLANYSGNPAFPGKIAHQFSSSQNTPPFGACDINSADGYSPAQYAAALGLVDAPVRPVAPPTAPAAPLAPRKHRRPRARRKAVHVVVAGDTLARIASEWHVTLRAVERANPNAGHPAGHFDVLMPGDKIVHP